MLDRLEELPDEDDYPDRDAFVADLVVRWGWPASKVGAFFRLTGRRVRAIAGEAPGIPTRGPAALTLAEARSMVNDYLRDPYARPGEVAAAREWIAGHCGA